MPSRVRFTVTVSAVPYDLLEHGRGCIEQGADHRLPQRVALAAPHRQAAWMPCDRAMYITSRPLRIVPFNGHLGSLGKCRAISATAQDLHTTKVAA